MDEIHQLFGKPNGVTPSWFSFNAKGACPICKDNGRIVYRMAFANRFEVVCEECGGLRHNSTALSYRYQDKTIEEYLTLTNDGTLVFFDRVSIKQQLKTLQDVGLGYMTLGQPNSTLSGGEIQRLKLAS